MLIVPCNELGKLPEVQCAPSDGSTALSFASLPGMVLAFASRAAGQTGQRRTNRLHELATGAIDDEAVAAIQPSQPPVDTAPL